MVTRVTFVSITLLVEHFPIHYMCGSTQQPSQTPSSLLFVVEQVNTSEIRVRHLKYGVARPYR